jgi:hypothetical protein
MSKWLKRHVAAFALICVAILPGCIETTATGAIKPSRGGCLIFKPIGWSMIDTPATIAEVKEHNFVWETTCKRR